MYTKKYDFAKWPVECLVPPKLTQYTTGFNQLFALLTWFMGVMCWHCWAIHAPNFVSIVLQLSISKLLFLLLPIYPLLPSYLFLNYPPNTLHCLYPFSTTNSIPLVGSYRWHFSNQGRYIWNRVGSELRSPETPFQSSCFQRSVPFAVTGSLKDS